jgi:hypothetical protein
VPPNNQCVDATVFDVNDIIMAGQNIGATNKGRCATDATETGPGVFYSFTGTGNVMTVSTCGTNTKYPTVLSVTEGCPGTGTSCIADEDPGFPIPCVGAAGNGKTVTFDSTSGTEYKVMVDGETDTNQGIFDFQVVDYPAPPNDVCLDAEGIPLLAGLPPITVNPPTVLVGEIANATTIQATKTTTTCRPTSSERGVWYIFTGRL